MVRSCDLQPVGGLGHRCVGSIRERSTEDGHDLVPAHAVACGGSLPRLVLPAEPLDEPIGGDVPTLQHAGGQVQAEPDVLQLRDLRACRVRDRGAELVETAEDNEVGLADVAEAVELASVCQGVRPGQMPPPPRRWRQRPQGRRMP